INSRWTVDGSGRRNIARYANHSCRPNAESDVVKRNVILRAIRKIKPGDEITYDYGSEYFEIFLKPVGCKCVKCAEKRRRQRRGRGRVGQGQARGRAAAVLPRRRRSKRKTGRCPPPWRRSCVPCRGGGHGFEADHADRGVDRRDGGGPVR